MNSLMNSDFDTILALINPQLRTIRRQRMQSSIVKAGIYGFSTSALLVALYLIFWPIAAAKISVVGTALLSQQTIEILITLVPVLGLWIALSIILIVLCLFYFYFQRKQTANASEFLHHLNRVHPDLEESAHLALIAPSNLSVLQSMQLRRILPSLLQVLKSPEPTSQLTSKTQQRFPHLLFTMLASAVLLIGVILATHEAYLIQDPIDLTEPEKAVGLNYLPQLSISVKAPSYTQQAPFVQNELDIKALQGSLIEWFIPLGNEAQVNHKANAKFELTLSSAEVLPFEKVEQGYRLSYVANAASVYTIVQITPSKSFITDIATLAIKLDAKPVINIKRPLLTITELAKNSVPELKTEVEIFDDYEVSNVNIVASIAKGSGESVKFRDQTFSFDSYSQIGEKSIYTKHWDLAALNMSPGDELYFSVHASDNKTPDTQTSISPTKIIRWLEDEEQEGIAGEAIVINFMPEYFKSQRQIIIETEALIEQQDLMSVEAFKQTSRALAIDQSDLKQSYGQYLGDEFESGVMHNMETGPSISTADEHDHSDSLAGTGDKKSSDNTEHSHEDEGRTRQASDLSGYQQVIEQFGHNHGEADIGFIKTSEGQINPKVLMKRALAEMWQAELYLQLSSPKLALPYETQALNYLNRAKQADRIYVKRLGFKPPPVSEERRYQGKLKDILSYQRSTQATQPINLNNRVLAFMSMVNRALTLQQVQEQKNTPEELSQDERQIVDDIAQLLTDRLSQAPEWVIQLATIKRIQMANSFSLSNCEACLQTLIVDLNTLLTAHIAPPLLRSRHLSTKHAASKAYSDVLLQPKPKQALKP